MNLEWSLSKKKKKIRTQTATEDTVGTSGKLKRWTEYLDDANE